MKQNRCSRPVGQGQPRMPVVCGVLAFFTIACSPHSADAQGIEHHAALDFIQIDTEHLQAKIRKNGYVSGVAAGSLLDRKTGARDLGFGLHIMDFLLGPGYKNDNYLRDKKLHGDLPKHFIEGPQICTQAKELTPEIIRGEGFLAVKLKYRFTQGYNGYPAGSLWEQTLLFFPDTRYFLACEEITCKNDVDNLIYRIDMPGHVKHRAGDSFLCIYLSYHGIIPAGEFVKDFAPDERFLYQRKEDKIPERMIRAYQTKLKDRPGPWLAGMTLDPAQVSEAWCHQRGYLCFIEELYGKKVKAGEVISTAYVVGYFSDLAEMERVYDKYKNVRKIVVTPKKYELK